MTTCTPSAKIILLRARGEINELYADANNVTDDVPYYNGYRSIHCLKMDRLMEPISC